MATRLPKYRMKDAVTRLGEGYFNPIWADLDNRLDTLERIKVDWDHQVTLLRDLGLSRIDEHIRPVVDEVNALLQQATDDTNGLAQQLVNDYLQPVVDSANELLLQVQNDTDTLAQDLVDDHIQPKVDDANALLLQAQQDASALADLLNNFATTDSREDPSTTTLLQAKAMADHGESGDHDERYYQKSEIDDFLDNANYQEFLASGIWTKPDGCKFVYVEIVNGGNSGAAVLTTGSKTSVSGGAGGCHLSFLIDADTLPETVPVVVGIGGTPNTLGPSLASLSANGNYGGQSAFGDFSPPAQDDGLGATSAAASPFYITTVDKLVLHDGGPAAAAIGTYDFTLKAPNTLKGGAGGGSGSTHSQIATTGAGQSYYHGDGGDADVVNNNNAQADNGEFPGGGGGAAQSFNVATTEKTVISGAGADGVVRVWSW